MYVTTLPFCLELKVFSVARINISSAVSFSDVRVTNWRLAPCDVISLSLYDSSAGGTLLACMDNISLWERSSNKDTLLEYFFHLFQGSDVVLTPVTPDIGRNGVEGYKRTPSEQATRALSTNRSNRKRMDDQGAMASLAANSTALTQALL